MGEKQRGHLFEEVWEAMKCGFKLSFARQDFENE